MPLGQNSYTRDFGRPISEEQDTCFPRFFTEAEQTMIDGVPSWREVEMVEIIMPGNNQTTKPVQYVSDIHKERWPKAYAAFKANEEMALNGTPLEQWPVLRRAQVLQLKSLEFRTVEDVARMSETAIQRVGMGGRELKKMAEVFVSNSQDNAIANKAIQDAAKFEQRCVEQDAQIRSLNEQLQTLGEQMRQIYAQQQAAQQNIASTPFAQHAAVPMPFPAAPAIVSPFAKFAALAPIESRVSERRDELSAFNHEHQNGPPETERPKPEALDLQVPARRRGRPPGSRTEAA